MSKMYFRVENENGTHPNLREYNRNIFENPFISSSEADRYIAEEIRKQVNGADDRCLFSCTRSLAVALLKYNYIGDNPLIIMECEENIVLVQLTNDKLSCTEYDIHNLGYPLKRYYPDMDIKICNYVLAVDDNNAFEKYIHNYVRTHRKKEASPQKDCEVVIKHMTDNLKITKHIDAVYILYALQMRTNFLKNELSRYYLENVYNELDISEEERQAFITITNYLCYNKKYEKRISKTIISEKLKEQRISMYYDAYWIACDILTKSNNVKDALNISESYITDILANEVIYAYYLSKNKVRKLFMNW